MSSREQFEAWGMSDPDLSEMLESEVYASISWMAWQAASKASEQQLAAVVAENAGLKSNLMFWDADNPELPYEHPDEIAMECEIAYDDTFEVQVAARMPNRKYRVVIMTDDDCQTEQVVSEEIQTPATDAYLAEVRASEAKHIYDSILDNPAVTDMESLVDWLEQYAKDSASFAAQLRQGAAQ